MKESALHVMMMMLLMLSILLLLFVPVELSPVQMRSSAPVGLRARAVPRCSHFACSFPHYFQVRGAALPVRRVRAD